MTWAIYSTPEDLSLMESALNTSGMAANDRNALNRYLQAGFNNWRTAPCIPPEHPCWATDGQESTPGGTCMRVVVINNGTLADFRALIRSLLAKYPSAADMRFFEQFMGNGWYAVDPYPPPPGYFSGMTCT